jgi:hypothetical protein
VHKTSPADKTTAQALQIAIFPSDLTLAMGWIFPFELKKVGWVVEDMRGGIDAFMREGLEFDFSHLEAIRAGMLES